MVTIRLAQDTDAAELLELNRLSNSADHIATDINYIKESLSMNKGESVFVAEEEGALIGFIAMHLTCSFAYHSPTVEITELFVKPDCRRRGIGRSLINKVKTRCEANDALELFLRVNRQNEAGLAFYRQCGLEQAEHFVYRIKYY